MLPATGRGQHLGHRVGVTQHDPPAHVHYPALDRGLHDLREQQPGRADARWPAPLATAHPLTEGPRDRPDIATQAVHADQHTRATRAGADARGQRVDQLPVAARTEHPAEPEALRAQPWPLLATRAPSPLAAEEKQGVCCAPLLPSPQRGAVCRPSRRSHPPVHAGGRPALPAPDACGLAGTARPPAPARRPPCAHPARTPPRWLAGDIRALAASPPSSPPRRACATPGTLSRSSRYRCPDTAYSETARPSDCGCGWSPAPAPLLRVSFSCGLLDRPRKQGRREGYTRR